MLDLIVRAVVKPGEANDQTSRQEEGDGIDRFNVVQPSSKHTSYSGWYPRQALGARKQERLLVFTINNKKQAISQSVRIAVLLRRYPPSILSFVSDYLMMMFMLQRVLLEGHVY